MINAMPARGPSFFRRGRILEVESSRSNPPALSTAYSTASLFSTDRWDASGPEGRVSASDFAFRALASHASMRLATMTKSTIVQSARIIMGLASEMVDTIKSSRFMFFTFLPDCVLFRRIHMTDIGRRAMSLRMECLASTSCRRWGVRRLEVPGAQVEKPENDREREQCDRGHQAPVLQYCEQSVDRCHRRPPTIMTIAPMSHSAKM